MLRKLVTSKVAVMASGVRPVKREKTDGAEQGPAYHIKRAEIKGAIGIDPFGTMMHLVKDLPQLIASMHGTMPYIYTELV